MKRLLSFVLSVILVVSCFSAEMNVFADSKGIGNMIVHGEEPLTYSFTTSNYKSAHKIKFKKQTYKTKENYGCYVYLGDTKTYCFVSSGGTILKNKKINNIKYKYIYVYSDVYGQSSNHSIINTQISQKGEIEQYNKDKNSIRIRGKSIKKFDADSATTTQNYTNESFDLIGSNVGSKKNIIISKPQKGKKYVIVDGMKFNFKDAYAFGNTYAWTSSKENIVLAKRKYKNIKIHEKVYSKNRTFNAFKNKKCQMVEMKVNGKWEAHGITCFKSGSDIYQIEIHAYN